LTSSKTEMFKALKSSYKVPQPPAYKSGVVVRRTLSPQVCHQMLYANQEKVLLKV